MVSSTAMAYNQAEFIVRQRMEALKIEALEQINRLMQHQHRLDALRSDLDLSVLMKRYHAEQSYVSIAAQWYAEQTWWRKISIIMTATLIGNIFFFPFVISLMISVTSALLLLNEDLAAKKHIHRVTGDLIALKQSLTGSIEHIRSITDSTNTILQSLCGLNTQLTEAYQALAAHLETIKAQSLRYEVIIDDLTSTTQTLQNHNAQIETELNNAKHIITSLQQESGSLRQVTKDIHDLSHTFHTDEIKLDAISVQIAQSTKEYADSTQSMIELLSTLSAKHPIPSEHNTPHVSDIMKAAEVTLLESSEHLSQQELKRANETEETQQLMADIEQSHIASTSLLATFFSRTENLNKENKPQTDHSAALG